MGNLNVSLHKNILWRFIVNCNRRFWKSLGTIYSYGARAMDLPAYCGRACLESFLRNGRLIL